MDLKLKFVNTSIHYFFVWFFSLFLHLLSNCFICGFFEIISLLGFQVWLWVLHWV